MNTPRSGGWLRLAIAIRSAAGGIAGRAAAPAATAGDGGSRCGGDEGGQGRLYTSIDLEVAAKIVQSFEAK